MARIHFRATVRDQQGRAVADALARVYLKGTVTPVSDMWNAAVAGAAITTLTSTTSQGELEGWFDTPKEIDVLLTDNSGAAYPIAQPGTPCPAFSITETYSLVSLETVLLTGNQTVAGEKSFSDLVSCTKPVGTGLLANGNLDGTGGGTVLRVGVSIAMANGTNGIRGDSIASDTPNIGGHSSFVHFQSVGTFADRGSHIGYLSAFTHAPSGIGAYAEQAGFVSQIQHQRLGGVSEGYESAIYIGVGQQGRIMGYTAVISESNAVITYWDRAFFATSVGAQKGGDAFYANGIGGWNNFMVGLHTDGTQRFRVDSTGKLFIGSLLRTWYADANGLVSDTRVTASELVAVGASYADGFYNRTDPTVVFGWTPISPEGTLAAKVGAFVGNLGGGSGTAAYVKSTGAGTSAGWERILTAAAAKPTGVAVTAAAIHAALVTLNLIAP